MDKFLTDAGVAHEIIVVNQADTFRFNRAALINAGYLFSVSAGDFDYMARVTNISNWEVFFSEKFLNDPVNKPCTTSILSQPLTR